jgi:hypothetical protein
MTEEKFSEENLLTPIKKMVIDPNFDETYLSTDQNYKFVEHPNNPDAEYRCVELLYGKFAGLIYRYGRFKIEGRDNPDKSRSLNYEYDIIHIPDNIKGVDYPTEVEKEFNDLLASVLMDIVNNWVASNKEETIFVKDKDVEARDNDTEKSVARRTIYPAGDPLSKE